MKDLIDFAFNKYGKPPADIIEGMRNGFFIDYIDTPLPELKEWTWKNAT